MRRGAQGRCFRWPRRASPLTRGHAAGHLTWMQNQSSSAARLGAVACLLVLGSGYKREEPNWAPMSAGNAPPSGRLASPAAGRQNAAVPPVAAPAGAEGLAWDLPRGWTETRASGMRFATLKPPVTGKIDVSVVVLPGPAGGELANVNRWRGQIGLPPVDEPARAKMRQQVDAKAGAISLYDFATEGPTRQRMMVGLLWSGGRTWFVKMVGDEPAAEAARDDFVKLLTSLHVPGGA